MIHIERFTFNVFMVNTYLLWDETQEALIIDAACYEPFEQQALLDFIENAGLKPVRNVNTHCHIDHVLGNNFIFRHFGIKPEYHTEGAPFFLTAKEVAISFGFKMDGIPEPAGYISEGTAVTFGKSSLQVLDTPGHADGSVCLYSPSDGFVITGDVLFKDTIGRTDLPSGDFDKLMKSIKTRLFTLPDDTVVYPGHGEATTIGYEKRNNPFVR